MKKLIYTILTCGTVLMTACDDFLNELPETVIGSEAYFKTQNHFEQAVNGAYAPLQGLHTGQFWILAEMRSDNTSYQQNTQDLSGIPRNENDEFRELDNNGEPTNFFNTSFNGISRCNVILDKIESMSFSEEVTNRIVGQAKFLRGFYYFNLVRLFGDVPLIIHEIKSPDESFINAVQVPADQIYQQIASDFQDAIEALPPSYSDSKDKGRVTKGTALTFLAKVHMTKGDFSSAIPLLREVMTLGYSLLSSYTNIFSIANKNNTESIFEIQYLDLVNESSDFAYSFAPWNSGTSVLPLGVRPGAGSGWNTPTQDMLDAYEPNDIRKDASVAFFNTTIPYVIKYNSLHSVRYQTASNWVVTRYADVLLMLAECLNEGGYVADGEAFGLLNEVRTRATLSNKTSSNADPLLQVANQGEFRNAVAQERRVELAFENHRWFDLLRTGEADEVMKAHGVEEKGLKSYILNDAYTNIRLTFQYPRREALLLLSIGN